MRYFGKTALIILLCCNQICSGQTNKLSDFSIIDYNNIFNPYRRAKITNDIPVLKTNNIFYLAGTMTYDGETFAVFNSTNLIYKKFLTFDDKIDKFVISDISYDFVVLTETNRTNNLILKVGEKVYLQE